MTATASAITPVSRRRGGGMSDVRFALIIVGGVIAFHAIVVLVPPFSAVTQWSINVR